MITFIVSPPTRARQLSPRPVPQILVRIPDEGVEGAETRQGGYPVRHSGPFWTG